MAQKSTFDEQISAISRLLRKNASCSADRTVLTDAIATLQVLNKLSLELHDESPNDKRVAFLLESLFLT